MLFEVVLVTVTPLNETVIGAFESKPVPCTVTVVPTILEDPEVVSVSFAFIAMVRVLEAVNPEPSFAVTV